MVVVVLLGLVCAWAQRQTDLFLRSCCITAFRTKTVSHQGWQIYRIGLPCAGMRRLKSHPEVQSPSIEQDLLVQVRIKITKSAADCGETWGGVASTKSLGHLVLESFRLKAHLCFIRLIWLLWMDFDRARKGRDFPCALCGPGPASETGSSSENLIDWSE